MADLFGNPSLVTRLAVGKGVGFLIGLAAFIMVPYWWPNEGWALRFGILFWYTTMGGVIGFVGVMSHHPVLPFRMPYWFRGPVIGGWMNFVLLLLMYDKLQIMMDSAANWMWLRGISPVWIIMEGALAGLLIGWLSTRFGGEGKATADVLTDA